MVHPVELGTNMIERPVILGRANAVQEEIDIDFQEAEAISGLHSICLWPTSHLVYTYQAGHVCN
jgi:hypothetical protein